MPAAVLIELTDKDRKEFHRRCRSGTIPVRNKKRLSIFLLADNHRCSRTYTGFLSGYWRDRNISQYIH